MCEIFIKPNYFADEPTAMTITIGINTIAKQMSPIPQIIPKIPQFLEFSDFL